MNKTKNIKENEFAAAPGGTNGTLNYGQSYGTFSSPNASQNPSQFSNSNNNKAMGSNSNTRQDTVNSGSMAKDLNTIYSKKETPSPDEVVTGIKYELSQMIKKDKALAKQKVVKNLKTNPKFYSSLQQLNIDDKTMMDNVTENKHPNDRVASEKIKVNSIETKKIFTEMANLRDNKYVVNSNIVDAMKQSWDLKNKRNTWKSGK